MLCQEPTTNEIFGKGKEWISENDSRIRKQNLLGKGWRERIKWKTKLKDERIMRDRGGLEDRMKRNWFKL